MEVQKVAVISGSTSGIGYCIAEQLLGAGYYVYINGRSQKKCDQAYAKLTAISPNVSCLVGDINCTENYISWLRQLQTRHQTIQLLVSNVGSGKYPNSQNINIDVYNQAMGVNFFSAVTFCQEFISHLSQPSAVVFISSIAGAAPLGAPTPYACAKAALNMYMKEQALRFAKQSIRFNCISPGNVMFDGSTWDEKLQKDQGQTLDYIAKNVPMNCFIEPKSIANIVLTIANTPELTGQNLVIDGGQIVGRS
ncbi:SDR family oxidoreductase [Paraglaciecola sp.]|uniref:SDR family NAD(P)-dependent oxidoreductase n=1 Tax=Paraglaciecola sp. TaxID=1920173 RepID=UPI003263E099